MHIAAAIGVKWAVLHDLHVVRGVTTRECCYVIGVLNRNISALLQVETAF